MNVYSTNHFQIGVDSKRHPQTGNVTQIQRNKLSNVYFWGSLFLKR